MWNWVISIEIVVAWLWGGVSTSLPTDWHKSFSGRVIQFYPAPRRYWWSTDLLKTGDCVEGKSVECSYISPKTIDRFFCVHGVLYPSDYNTGANHEMIQRHNQQLKEELSNVRGALSVEVCNNSEAVGSAGISTTISNLHIGSKDYWDLRWK